MDVYGKTGAAIGAATGFVKFLNNIDLSLFKRLFESGLAAMISGALGALGSWLIMRIIKKVSNGKSEK